MKATRAAPSAPRPVSHSLLAAAAFAAAVTVTAYSGARFNPGKGVARRWYRRLRKPPFNPPNWVFPVAWTPLYTMIAASGYRVWRSGHPDREKALRLWALQLALNGAWPPLFFGLRRPGVAMAEIGLLWSAVAAYTRVSYRVDPPASLLVVPYAGWVTFAALLNAEIVRKNP
jgi:translocator protein